MSDEMGLDTSVVVRLLTGAPADLTELARRYLMDLAASGRRAVVNDLVISEAYHSLCHHYHVSKEDALKGLHAMLEDRWIMPTGEAGRVLATPGLHRANPGFVDRLIHADYLREGREMATCEKAAGKLPGVRVLKA